MKISSFLVGVITAMADAEAITAVMMFIMLIIVSIVLFAFVYAIDTFARVAPDKLVLHI